MPYLIDSDVVIEHLADVEAATQLLEKLATDGIVVSIITFMKACQGVLRSPHPKSARKQFEAFLETARCFHFLSSVPNGVLSCGKPSINRASALKDELLIL